MTQTQFTDPPTMEGASVRRPGRRWRPRGVARAIPLLLMLTAVLSSIVYLVTSGEKQSLTTPGQAQPCAYTRHDLGVQRDLEADLDFAFDCALLFNDTAPNWDVWAKPWFLHAPKRDTKFDWPGWVQQLQQRRVIVTQSLIPANVPGDWRARGAAGEYDEHARVLGNELVAAGMGDSVIRLGHEANGDWYRWQVGKTPAERQQWKQFWARTASILKSTKGSRFLLDWTVAAGQGAVPVDQLYPGDEAVDLVGVDIYDIVPKGIGSSSAARWKSLDRGRNGIAAVAELARRHGKPLTVPEWGLSTATDKGGGGDSPAFVKSIADLLRRERVEYHAYFETKPVGAPMAWAPQARAAWIREFGLAQ